MTFEKAHNFLEYFQSIMTQLHNRSYFDQSLIEVYGKAIEALEKQIPMEHHHTRLSANPFIVRESVCPHCLGVIVSQKNEYPNYCEWCGQAIDWNDYKKQSMQFIHDMFEKAGEIK